MTSPSTVTRPLVSVVMIFKDAVRFIAEAADSVLDQTWQPLELVLVDDGGSDGSRYIADSIAAAHPDRVRVVSHRGRSSLGTGPSRALGIRTARGDLTAFLDADDRWDPGHLEHEVSLLLAHPAAEMVVGRATTWRSWDGGADETTPLPFAPGAVVDPPRLLTAVLRNGSMATPTCSLLARSRAIRACLPHLEGFRSTYEDQVVNTLLQLRCAAVVSGTATAWYRQHPSSLSAQALRMGHEATSGPSVSRRRFVRWLDTLPEVHADPTGELPALVRAALQEQQGRAAIRALIRRAGRSVLVAAGLQQQVGRLRAVVHSRRGVRTPAIAPAHGGVPGRWSPVHRTYAEAFLHEFGADLHGDVAAVGVPPAPPGRRARPVPGWDDLGEGSYDCLVVGADPAADEAADMVVSLRAALRPGGALLVFLPGVRQVTGGPAGPARVWTAVAAADLLATAFDPRLVTARQMGNPDAAVAALKGTALAGESGGPGDPASPVLVAVRALVPA